MQRIPSALNTVQAILDGGARLRFLLTGSSARKLKRHEVNLLPGRVIQEALDPLSVLEVGADFNLQRALQVGMLPGIYLDQAEGVEVLSAYSDLYLREEIRAEALTRNFGAYARFLDIAALSSGQWINYSKLSSDAEVPVETLRRYVGLLEDTLVGFTLLPFYETAKVKSKRVSQRERLFIFDIGVRNALLGMHRHPLSADQVGPAFEQWFIQQVLILSRALKKNWILSSYRTSTGAEVDLVINTGKTLIAIEIKSGKQIRKEQTTGLLSFHSSLDKPKRCEMWIVYTGETRQVWEPAIQIYPYLDCLHHLTSM